MKGKKSTDREPDQEETDKNEAEMLKLKIRAALSKEVKKFVQALRLLMRQ